MAEKPSAGKDSQTSASTSQDVKPRAVATETSSEPAAQKRPSQEDSPAIDLAKAKGTITGIAVDAEGQGVEDVNVEVYREEREPQAIGTTTTDANGRFTIENVPIGNELVLKVVKKKSLFGVRGIKQHVSVEIGKTTDVGKVELKIPAHSK